jgi:hypothetical protein
VPVNGSCDLSRPSGRQSTFASLDIIDADDSVIALLIDVDTKRIRRAVWNFFAWPFVVAFEIRTLCPKTRIAEVFDLPFEIGMNGGAVLARRWEVAARADCIDSRIGAAAYLLEAWAGAINLILAKLADEA